MRSGWCRCFLLLSQPRAWLLGWLHGIATWSVALFWLVDTLTTYGEIEGWLAGLLLLGLSAVLGLYHLVFAAIASRLWRRGGGFRLAALPALWVLLEVLRGFLITGFPWNLAAYAWTAIPGALPLAAWIGAWGVSFLVVLVSAGVARAVATRRWESAALVVLLRRHPAAGGRTLGVRGAAENRAARRAAPRGHRAAQYCESGRLRSGALRVGLCPPPGAHRRGLPAGNARALAGERRVAAALRARCRASHPTSRASPRCGCAVLLNSVSEEGEGREEGGSGKLYFNSALLISPGRPPARYDKRHLVPFGEYVPLGRLFSFISSLARNAGDFSPAQELRLLDWEGERLGPAICYEVVFPDEVAQLTRAGATVLVSMTNDAWYGDTAAPWQHLRAARFRAAENRRWLLRAAITGVSAAIAPDGSVRAQFGVGERGVLQVSFQGRSDLAPFARAPWVVPALCAALLAVAVRPPPARQSSPANRRSRVGLIFSFASCSPPNCSSASAA